MASVGSKDTFLLLRSTLIYAPAIFLTRISALLLLMVATRLIDQTEYGLLTLVVTVGELTDIAVANWLRIALLRLGGKGEINTGTVKLASKVLLGTTFVGLLIAVAASGLIAPERWADFAVAVCAYLVAGSVGRFALTILQMQQRHSIYSMLEFLRAILQLALPVGAIVVFHSSFLMVSLGSSLAVLITGLVAATMALGRIVPGSPRFTHREFFAFGVPLIVLALVGFGLNSAERIFLKVYYDAGAVAIFAAAYALARQPIDMVANAINMGAFPEVVSRFDEEGPQSAARFLSHLLALMMRLCLPVAALLVALGSDITGLVLPDDYHGHVDQIFPIIAFSVLCGNVASFVYGDIVHAHKRPWLLTIANGLGSVATITLSVLLIPPLAEMGAALALAGGSLVGLAACILMSHRLTVIPVPWRDMGLSVLIAMVAGLAAYWVSTALTGMPPLLKLAAGGTAGGLIFLGSNWLLYPREAHQLFGKVRSRLGFA